MSSTTAQKIALVTGANKGIGYAIVRILSQKSPETRILAGARDVSRGEEALKSWKAEGVNNVELIQLDIDSEQSIKQAASEIKQKFGGLDILINNAGIAWKGDAFDETVARGTIATNYYGTLHMHYQFVPLMRPHGRIVNVSSTAGVSALQKCVPELQKRFLAEDLSIEQLNALMEEFISDVKNNRWDGKWPKTTYGVSKTGVTQMTRIFARDNKTEGLLINACCPGWIRTDMAGPKAPGTPEEGADTPVYLALLPNGSESGKFWKDRQVKPFM